MKNVIMYYYNLNNINIYKINDRNYVKYKNEIYLFQPVINERETIEIYNLLKNNSKFYRIILNKDKTIFTPYKGTKFVLQKIFSNKIELIYNPIKYFQVINSKTTLDRTNWIYLWQIKIDYYEYQLKHISGKYPIIDESINYFIGMAETAISYIKYNCKKIEYNDDVTFCRRRINKEDFYNPLNIIIDYKERDIGEYLKYIFWNNEYKYINLDKIIRETGNSINSYHLLFGRLLYPGFYFDIYDQIINYRENEKKLLEVISRIDEYESYLSDISKIINEYYEIVTINWIKKI